MTSDLDTRRPRAFAPDDPALNEGAQTAARQPEGGEAPLAARRTRQTMARTSVRPTFADLSRGIRWGGVLLSSLAGLFAMATVLWFTRYVEVALARQDWVGWLAFALLCLVGLSVLVLVLREIIGLFRLARLGRLRTEVREALNAACAISRRCSPDAPISPGPSRALPSTRARCSIPASSWRSPTAS
jgi:putative membrane protein